MSLTRSEKRRFASLLWAVSAFSFVGQPATAADTIDLALAEAAPLVSEAYTYFHENPELGKQEFKAQAYLRKQLEALGFTDFVASKLAPTAVIALFDSGRPGPTIALRAEMDGRKLEGSLNEPADHQPRSSIDGLMHNCGHDAHAAMLLGTAAIVVRNRERFGGKIVFLFQPAEESAGGADDIVAENILQDRGVQSIFAQHVAPGLRLGDVAAGPGYALAGSNYFSLKLRGRGSHAAAPADGTDTPLVAARMAIALATYPARHLDVANRPVVISVTRIHSDAGASNAIPAIAELHGTVRAFEDIDAAGPTQPSLKTTLSDFIARLAASEQVEADLSFKTGAPPTLNNPILFDAVGRKVADAWGSGFDRSLGKGMYAEDFAYYTVRLPALYFSLGIAKEEAGTAGVHSIDFAVPNDALVKGLRLMTTIALVGTEMKSW